MAEQCACILFLVLLIITTVHVGIAADVTQTRHRRSVSKAFNIMLHLYNVHPLTNSNVYQNYANHVLHPNSRKTIPEIDSDNDNQDEQKDENIEAIKTKKVYEEFDPEMFLDPDITSLKTSQIDTTTLQYMKSNIFYNPIITTTQPNKSSQNMRPITHITYLEEEHFTTEQEPNPLEEISIPKENEDTKARDDEQDFFNENNENHDDVMIL